MQGGKSRRERPGFTLVELLIVVGIMVLLASIAVIAVAPFLKGRSLAAATRRVQGMIYEARAHAAATQHTTTVYFDVQGRAVSVYSTPDVVPGKFDNRIDGPEYLPAGVQFADDPPVTGGTGPKNKLVFSPNGSLDPLTMGTGNRSVRLASETGTNVRVIEVIFVSGLTRIHDEVVP